MADQLNRIEGNRAEHLEINVVQNNYGPEGAQARGWLEALVRGPLQRLGLDARAAAARQLADDERWLEAANEFGQIAEALRSHDYGPAADSYRRQAADAYVKASSRSQAFPLYLGLARAAVGDGELTATFAARRAVETAPDERRWEAEALLARANWPEIDHGDLEALRAAWAQSRMTDSEPEYAAALIEWLLLGGHDEAVSVGEEVRQRHKLATGARLDLELDYLDLLEGAKGPALTEPIWKTVLSWADDTRQRTVEETARVYQRRGVVLAARGDKDGSRAAFDKSISTWSREAGFEEQAAEAYFSGLAAAMASGEFTAVFDGARDLAMRLRGSRETATSRVADLQLRGLRHLVDEKLPDAHRLMQTACNIARKAGNFNDLLTSRRGLGDILVAADHPREAVQAFVDAGEAERAKSPAAALSLEEVVSLLRRDGANWTRVAAWSATAAAGREISDACAAELANEGLAEIQAVPPWGFPTNASFYAAEVLANIVPAMQPPLLENVAGALRERLHRQAGDPRQLARPLEELTALGRSDETATLVEALLNPHNHARLNDGLLGEHLASHPELLSRVVDAAAGGTEGALRVLAFADRLDANENMKKLAAERVQRGAQYEPRQITKNEDGSATRRVDMGMSFAMEGLMARGVDVELRTTFVARMSSLVDDETLPMMVRVGAIDGLHNAMSTIADDQLTHVAAVLARASGPETVAEFDRLNVDERLARSTLDFAPAGALQAAAIDALRLLVASAPRHMGLLRLAAAAAVGSGNEHALRACLDALGAHPQLEIPGLPLEAAVRHEVGWIRGRAVGALWVRADHDREKLLMLMTRDPDELVRRGALAIAADDPAGLTSASEALADDPDCYVRALARAARHGGSPAEAQAA